MPDTRAPLRVTALAVSAQLGGTERVLLDFAAHAFEHDVALRVITPRNGPLLSILNDLGIPAEVVEGSRAMLRGSQRGRALGALPAALTGLARWAGSVRRHPLVADADLIYSVGFKPHFATTRLGDAPCVWHLHEFPPAVTGRFWKMLARRVPVGLIANSRAVGAAWRDPAGTPLSVVPNGVDLDRFRPRERSFWIHDRLGIGRDRRLIGMPAVLARWKGQPEVLEAFERLGRTHADVDLVFVGGSIYDTVAERAYEAELGRRIDARPPAIRQRVHRLPFHEDVERVYPEFDLTVHYSTRPEAFGRVVLESMACAVPILAAAEGGPTEIVTEGGWLVDPRNPGALAEAAAAALSLPAEELRAVGRWGRVRAEDHYSARRFAREVAAVLWEGVGETPAP